MNDPVPRRVARSLFSNPLRFVWQHGKIIRALPNSAEVRNGQVGNGGSYSVGWLDASMAQATKTWTHLHLCRSEKRRKSSRALYCTTQQDRRNDIRTDHFETSDNQIIVLSVAESISVAWKPTDMNSCIGHLMHIIAHRARGGRKGILSREHH